MQIEVAFGHDLEERLAVEVDIFVLLVGLIVDVGVGESRWVRMYPLDMMSPLKPFSGIVLTPWILIISPHLIVYCSYDMQDIS